eukprot:Colp12_sorted_trinity150504_noHs@34026
MPEAKAMEVDRELLNPNFDGFKLAEESLSKWSTAVESSVNLLHCDAAHYSLEYIKRFELHNHLHTDPFHPEHAYFIDDKWNVHKVTHTEDKSVCVEKVYTIPKPANSVLEQHDHATLAFSSENTALCADGWGNLFVLNTGARNGSSTWEQLFSTQLCNGIPFMILSAVETESFIRVLASRMTAVPKLESGERDYTSLLYVMSLKKEGPTYVPSTSAVLKGKLPPVYAAFETNGEAFLVLSSSQYSPDNEEVQKSEDEVVKEAKEEEDERVLDEEKIAAAHKQLEKYTTEEEVQPPEFNAAAAQEDLEECDYEPDNEKPQSFYRYTVDGLNLTHTAPVVGYSFLCTLPAVGKELPSAAFKYGVDVLVYKIGDGATLTHTKTFPALAYVQASKRDKRFLALSHQASYALLTDNSRNAFFYQQPAAGASTAPQFVVSTSEDPIVGVHATSKRSFVLTTRDVFIVSTP